MTTDTKRRSGVVLALFAIALGASNASGQEVRFLSTTYEVIEGTPQISVVVAPTAPIEDYAGCVVSFEPVSAEEGPDYTPLGGWVDWFGGDASSRSVAVGITDDEEPEGTETFRAVISYSKGVAIGSPSEATITILDDDGGGGEQFAYVEMTGAERNAQGDWVVFAPAGSTFDVTVRYTEVPASPVSIDWASDAAPFEGTVVFDDTDSESVTLSLPTPKGTSPMVLTEFRLLQANDPSPRDALTRGFDFSTFNFFVGTGAFTGTDCWGCVFYLFSNLADFGPCPFDCDFLDLCGGTARWQGARSDAQPGWVRRGARLGDAVFPLRLDLMRRYRDDILATTETGAYYVSEYESFSEDAVAATLRQPMLFFRIMDVIEAWVPALVDLLDGTGNGVFVTQSMVDRLEVVLDAFEEVGDPAFAAKIATEREKLSVDTLVGLSAGGVQERIETEGGELPTETLTWGQIKQRFR